MSADDLLAQLRSHVGAEMPMNAARHPVNAPAIADWCDAMGDTNPCYTDEDFAAKSRHGGLVAPPATLDIWDRPGLPGQYAGRPAAQDPRSQVLRLLEANGFVGVVAVNSELEIARYLRPGDRLHNVQVIEDVSPEKQTALGVGHFVTTRQRYSTTEGEHVGDLLFRILKFRPGTGAPAKAPSAQAEQPARTAPDSDPALRPRPSVNRDNAAIWEGYRQRELRIPRCEQCGALHMPPTPHCHHCGAFAMGYTVSSGRGTLYSFNVVHHPQVPGFRYPLAVALVELEEGVRFLADVVGARPEQLHVGMPMEVDWLQAGDNVLPRLRPATPPRREDTLT